MFLSETELIISASKAMVLFILSVFPFSRVILVCHSCLCSFLSLSLSLSLIISLHCAASRALPRMQMAVHKKKVVGG